MANNHHDQHTIDHFTLPTLPSKDEKKIYRERWTQPYSSVYATQRAFAFGRKMYKCGKGLSPTTRRILQTHPITTLTAHRCTPEKFRAENKSHEGQKNGQQTHTHTEFYESSNAKHVRSFIQKNSNFRLENIHLCGIYADNLHCAQYFIVTCP